MHCRTSASSRRQRGARSYSLAAVWDPAPRRQLPTRFHAHTGPRHPAKARCAHSSGYPPITQHTLRALVAHCLQHDIG